MPGHLLYSTNSFLKLLIQERFRKNVHYVWCSETFDGSKLAAYTGASLIAPSSNPADIYRQLRADCDRSDRHSAKIAQTKATLRALAVDWRAKGEISDSEKADIEYLVDNADFKEWRPLLYVIPRHLVAARMLAVPAHKCASFGPEYIIPDLQATEFELLEL